MAEAILFDIAGEILMKLSSQAFQRLGMLFGLKDNLNKLTATVSTIKDVLLDAEGRQTKGHLLENWLQKLEEALYDAEDVLDELSTEALHREVMTRDKNAKQVRIFFSKSNQIAFNYSMARQIKKIWERLDAIDAEKKQFHLHENCESKARYGSFDQIMTGRESWSFSNGEEVIGRDDDKKKIKDLLLDVNMNVTHNVSIVAIVGMGGIGKTTLAKSLYNDEKLSKYFELKIWIWVSDQFEIKAVVKKIIESATKSNPHVMGMEALQAELQKVIGGKKYLLVMDDVWNESEEKWHGLKPLLMSGAKGSKILITKRDRKVAAEIESMTSLFSLEGLPESKSWSLFSKVAFKEGKELENPNLIQTGKEILMKCGGVPLVIRHIGRLLYSRTTEEEWMSFKDNELLEIIQQDNDMTSVLKLSYNHLPPNLKQCFAYLSLFPKRKSLKINDLIRQWMALGFIETSNGSKSMEETGKGYFKELCWRFFLENSMNECNFDNDVHMHDVMRDLATNVAGKKYVRENINCDYAFSEKTRHVSFDCKIKSWSDVLSKLHKAKGLRTFQLFSSNFEYEKKNEINEAILDEVFSSFPRLRVLGLNNSNSPMVPNSIRRLRHLRYLDLSENNMESLPNSITELRNLQTLNLMYCGDLKELPRDTSNLVNLRHLDFNTSILTHMPEGMGKLSCLQTLSYFVLDCKRSNQLSELDVLIHLNGYLRIIGLEQLRSESEVSLVNLKDIKGLKKLELEWKLSGDDQEYEGENDETAIMEGLEPHPNIESLHIDGYSGVGLPNWVVSTSLSKLTNIVIHKCHRLQHLSQMGHLQALTFLYLDDMRSLKFIDKNEPSFSSSFPSLKLLIIENMPNLEGWWELGNTQKNWLPLTFPKLISLHISGCPMFSFMPKPASTGAVVFLCDASVQLITILGPLCSLESLTLEEIKDLKYLEIMESQQNLDSLPIRLRHLRIRKCLNLMSLPEWIGILTSLEELEIMECPKLKSLPEGMQKLESLRSFLIGGCPEVEERCKQGGEDWAKIAHIPHFEQFLLDN
ncbi:putative disease resistance protein RGA4 [Benincasa hispida]|uniref:putative disease resistance protein RGA4 n=1 Tax=Benincasa hispida TaxID=102211 RepID=UPI0019024BBF|nr:putative disease resistance protein RGA4 [Benincasa hispida]